MPNVQIKYQVNSSDQLKLLEDAMKSFKSSYTLKGVGTVFVSELLASKLSLTPEGSSSIEEICLLSDERPKGTVINSSPNQLYLMIGETSYIINYKAE